MQSDKFNSNINEVVRTVLNFLFIYFFFYEKILYAPKSTKKHQRHQKTPKTQKHKQAKAQNVNKRTKTENARKKHLSGKK